MGYLGFGKSSGDYKQRPRKAFSKRSRSKSRNSIPLYRASFKLQPSKKSSRFNSFIVIIAVVISVVVFSIFYNKFESYSNKFEKEKVRNTKNSNNSAFIFLVDSRKIKTSKP